MYLCPHAVVLALSMRFWEKKVLEQHEEFCTGSLAAVYRRRRAFMQLKHNRAFLV